MILFYVLVQINLMIWHFEILIGRYLTYSPMPFVGGGLFLKVFLHTRSSSLELKSQIQAISSSYKGNYYYKIRRSPINTYTADAPCGQCCIVCSSWLMWDLALWIVLNVITKHVFSLKILNGNNPFVSSLINSYIIER